MMMIMMMMMMMIKQTAGSIVKTCQEHHILLMISADCEKDCRKKGSCNLLEDFTLMHTLGKYILRIVGFYKFLGYRLYLIEVYINSSIIFRHGNYIRNLLGLHTHSNSWVTMQTKYYIQ